MQRSQAAAFLAEMKEVTFSPALMSNERDYQYAQASAVGASHQVVDVADILFFKEAV